MMLLSKMTARDAARATGIPANLCQEFLWAMSRVGAGDATVTTDQNGITVVFPGARHSTYDARLAHSEGWLRVFFQGGLRSKRLLEAEPEWTGLRRVNPNFVSITAVPGLVRRSLTA